MFKTLLNRFLVFVGCTLYLIAFAWSIVGVWFFSIGSIKLTILMLETGLPPDEAAVNQNMMWVWFLMATYYLFKSKAVSNMFFSFPVIKPMMIVGFVFFTGLTLINNVIYHLCLNDEMSVNLLFWIAIVGIVLIRIIMSVFFHRYPAEWFASR